MSFRLASRKLWAQAQSDGVAATRYICPRCLASGSARSLSTSKCRRDRSENNGASHDGSQSKLRPVLSQYVYRTQKVFSLIQPTGIPHLGNYLGAVRRWKDFQDEKATGKEADRRRVLMYGLADLHSLTSEQSPEQRRISIRETFASLLAVGIDPDLSTLFVQSHVPEHSELNWILSNVASMGYLSRMTQWKDKMGLKQEDFGTAASLMKLGEKSTKDGQLKLALFSYPVLQAADILLYRPNIVPVGADQAQHVEFTRQLARSFNAKFVAPGDPPILNVPRVVLSPAQRIMSLTKPTKKMSKSDRDGMSRILITDSPEVIMHKFQKAKTDSIEGPITYSPEQRPGVSNLIDIYKHISRNPKSQESIARDLASTSLGTFKAVVAETVIGGLKGIRERYLELMETNNTYIDEVMHKGASEMKGRAVVTMGKVRKAIGMYNPMEVLNPRESSSAEEDSEEFGL